MTPHRKKEIQKAIIRAMSAFGVDHSMQHQSMNLVGFRQMVRDIPFEELIEVLKSMEGVIFDFETNEVRIPISYFAHS